MRFLLDLGYCGPYKGLTKTQALRLIKRLTSTDDKRITTLEQRMDRLETMLSQLLSPDPEEE